MRSLSKTQQPARTGLSAVFPEATGHAEGGRPPRAAAFRDPGRAAQAAEPAFHWAQSMFQSLKPLSGETVLSPVLETTTTSPTIEWL